MKHGNALRRANDKSPRRASAFPSILGNANSVGSTMLAGRPPSSFTRAPPENRLPPPPRLRRAGRKKKLSLWTARTHGSRSNRSCARRALRTQPRVMEFGGTILLRKSHGIHTQGRGKRLLTKAFLIPPIRLARDANGSC